MKTLIILGLICVVGWLVLNKSPMPPGSQLHGDPLQSEAASPMPSPEKDIMLIDAPAISDVSQTVAVQGTVAGVRGDVVFVRCVAEYQPQRSLSSIYNTGSKPRSEAESMAAWAIYAQSQRSERHFGPLKVVDGGVVRDAKRVPDNHATGDIALYGYKPTSQGVHVVAVPTGKMFNGLPLFTAVFQQVAKPGPTSASIYPEGVDTPEERREYLQMLTELRKQRQQTGQR